MTSAATESDTSTWAQTRSLLVFGAVTALVAWLGSVATRDSVNSEWFRSLDKPVFYPPDQLFGDFVVPTAEVLQQRNPLVDAQPRERLGLRADLLHQRIHGHGARLQLLRRNHGGDSANIRPRPPSPT